MLKADDLQITMINIDGKWVVAKPLPQPFIRRIRDAIAVLKGKAEAVCFYKQ